jgi:predicted DNA-binding protein
MGQEDVNEKTLNVRLPESEFLLLAHYAAETGRTKTDVVRELLRSLEQKLAPEAKLKKPKAAKS